MIFYAIVGGVGLLFLILSYIIGEIGDLLGGLGDHEVNLGGHQVGLDHDGEVHIGPPLVNIRSLAAFVTGFGVVGFLLTAAGWSPYWALLPAAGSGVIMSLASYGITVLLYRQQATSSYNPNEMVGQFAEVTTPIPANGLGEVSLTFKGSFAHYAARAQDNQPISSGVRVQIVDLFGTTAIVSRPVIPNLSPPP